MTASWMSVDDASDPAGQPATPGQATRRRGRPCVDFSDRRTAAKRDQILDAAQRLIERKGAASIRDIEFETYMARGTLYRYFRSLDHIVASLQLRWIDHLERTFSCDSNDTQARLDAIIDATTSAVAHADVVARLTIEARQSASPGVFATCCELDRRVTEFLTVSLRECGSGAGRIIGPFKLAWYGALTQWAQGLLSLPQVEAELRLVAEVLLHGVAAAATSPQTMHSQA